MEKSSLKMDIDTEETINRDVEHLLVALATIMAISILAA